MASDWSAHAPVVARQAPNDRIRRDKRRRNLLVLAGIIVMVGIGAAALTYSQWNPRQTSGTTASGQTHVTPADATKCLTARGAVVAPNSARHVIRLFPGGAAPAVRVSFPLAHPFEFAILYFEPSRAIAQRAVAALAFREQRVPAAVFNSFFQTKNNVVVGWSKPKMTPASRSAVLGCLN